jgi:hypothetical protein
MQRYNSPMSRALNWTVPAKAGRAVLALVIACALALSFIHGASAGGDVAPPHIATLQADAGVQPPVQHAPAHGDHCLQHLQTFAAPAVIPVTLTIVCRQPSAGDVVLNGLEGLSLFRPPRLRAAS